MKSAPIKLTPMAPSRYEAWMQESIRAYAESNVESGRWDATDAMEKSEREHLGYFPEGLATPDHSVFELFVDSNYLGYLWVYADVTTAVHSAYIYDIEIVAEQRGKGFGKQTMLALEVWCKERNLKRIGLNVFAFNSAAIELYRGLGYETTNFRMQKELL
jgi:ribosomal protein S18 acetylase RimI-like enzyme